MADQDLRTVRLTSEDLKSSIPDCNPKTHSKTLQIHLSIATAAVSNLNAITKCVLQLCKHEPSIQGWEVFKRLRSRLSFSHKVHRTFEKGFPSNQDISEALQNLEGFLVAWEMELQELLEKDVENIGIQTASQWEEQPQDSTTRSEIDVENEVLRTAPQLEAELQESRTLSEKDAEDKDIPSALRSGEELQGSGTDSGNNPEHWDVPMASELELLIELRYKMSRDSLTDLDTVKTFLNGLMSKPSNSNDQGNLNTQCESVKLEPLPNLPDRAAGLPRMVFFCIGHPEGPICAATQPSYGGCPALHTFFQGLRNRRFATDPPTQAETDEKSQPPKDLGPFDHQGEPAKSFRLQLDGGSSPVFMEYARCAKCRELYLYACDEFSLTVVTKSFQKPACAEDLCHTYCVKGKTMTKKPHDSFF